MSAELRIPRLAAACGSAVLGVAMAGPADARTSMTDGVRPVGPDSVAAANAEAARAAGKLLLSRNKPVEALQSFRQALLQDPDSTEALNGIAVCYDRLGRYEDSRTHYEMALGIDPGSPTLLYNYGLSLFLQGNMQQASRFLALAAASGDAEVQAASLRTLARIDRGPARASAPVPETVSGPRVVRTSSYEQRLVLDTPPRPREQPVQMAALRTVAPTAVALPAADVVATAAIASLTPREEARIAAEEMAAIAAEQAQARAAQAEAMALAAAAAAPELPADMRSVLVSAQGTGPAGALPAAAAMASAFVFRQPTPADQDAGHLLDVAPPGRSDRQWDRRRQQAELALLHAGLVVPRPQAKAERIVISEAAGGSGLRKREFASPFQSDNGRLNGFADRMQGRQALAPMDDVAAQVARLEALIARVRSA